TGTQPRPDAFHVNIADPSQIAVVSAGDPIGIQRVVSIPHAGAHGLDIDVARRRLYCACDDATLVEVDADTGAIVTTDRIGGTADGVLFHCALGPSRDPPDGARPPPDFIRRDAEPDRRVPAGDAPRRRLSRRLTSSEGTRARTAGSWFSSDENKMGRGKNHH